MHLGTGQAHLHICLYKMKMSDQLVPHLMFSGLADELKGEKRVKMDANQRIRMLITTCLCLSALVTFVVASEATRTDQQRPASSGTGWKPVRIFAKLTASESLQNQVNSLERSPTLVHTNLKSTDEFASKCSESTRVRRHSRYPSGRQEPPTYDQSQNSDAGEDDEPEAGEPERAVGKLEARESAPNRRAPLGEQAQAEYDEAADRAEQEAAEASEADAANKSALDEQRQAQREIIRAQAASEAKAIREQQEALMRQQRLQQQMLLKRHHELEGHHSDPQARYQAGEQKRGVRRSQMRQQAASRRQMTGTGGRAGDIQFSDQPDKQSRGESEAAATRAVPVPVPLGFDLASKTLEPQEGGALGWLHLPGYSNGLRPEESQKLNEAELLAAAAGHSYGSNYGSLHGHQKDYYQ